MSVETLVYGALKNLVSNMVFRDIAPEKDPAGNPTPLPRITFQQVGGQSINFLEGGPVGIRAPRVQVNVWHTSRDAANALAIQVEEALRATAALKTEVLGDFVAVYETETKRFGTHQDFRFATT